MNHTAYQKMAAVLNEEYARYEKAKLALNNELKNTKQVLLDNRQRQSILNPNLAETQGTSDISNLENIQQYITQAGIDLTDFSQINHTDYTVSQIKNYQFWRSSNEMIIIDSQTNSLVTYAKLDDFFPEIISNEDLEKQSTNFLLSKASSFNNNLKLDYDYGIIKDSKQYIQSLNLYSSKTQARQESTNFLKNTFKSVSSYLKDFSSKINKNNLTKLQQEINLKAEVIKKQVISQCLANQARKMFDLAHQKTEEHQYHIGIYSVCKTKDNVLEIYDQNQNLLLVSLPGQEKIVLNNHLGELNELNKALTTFKQKNIPVVGDNKIEKQYESSIFQLVKNLSEYKNGTHTLKYNNTDIKLLKKADTISLYSAKKKNILAANSTGYQTNLSLKEVSALNQKVLQDLQIIDQNNSVSYAASVVKKYLELTSTNSFEKTNFKVTFDSASATISYWDKLDPSNSFQARKESNKWKRISGQITNEKKDYFVELNKKIDSSQQININTQAKSLNMSA